MEPAFKKKLADSVPDDARKKLGLFKPITEGPTRPVFRISVSPKYYDVLMQHKFVKLNIASNDGAFSLSAILKNRNSFLELVPMRMPPIDVKMGMQSFRDSVHTETVFSVEDGAGRAMEYVLLAIRPASGDNAPLRRNAKHFIQ